MVTQGLLRVTDCSVWGKTDCATKLGALLAAHQSTDRVSQDGSLGGSHWAAASLAQSSFVLKVELREAWLSSDIP